PPLPASCRPRDLAPHVRDIDDLLVGRTDPVRLVAQGEHPTDRALCPRDPSPQPPDLQEPLVELVVLRRGHSAASSAGSFTTSSSRSRPATGHIATSRLPISMQRSHGVISRSNTNSSSSPLSHSQSNVRRYASVRSTCSSSRAFSPSSVTASPRACSHGTDTPPQPAASSTPHTALGLTAVSWSWPVTDRSCAMPCGHVAISSVAVLNGNSRVTKHRRSQYLQYGPITPPQPCPARTRATRPDGHPTMPPSDTEPAPPARPGPTHGHAAPHASRTGSTPRRAARTSARVPRRQ